MERDALNQSGEAAKVRVAELEAKVALAGASAAEAAATFKSLTAMLQGQVRSSEAERGELRRKYKAFNVQAFEAGALVAEAEGLRFKVAELEEVGTQRNEQIAKLSALLEVSEMCGPQPPSYR